MSGRDDKHLALWARVMDILALALLELGAQIALSGRVLVRFGGIKISAQSPWRSVAFGVAVLAIRHAIVRRPSLPEHLATLWRRFAATIRRLSDDRLLLGMDASIPSTISTGRRVLVGAGVVLLFTALTALMTYPQVRQLDAVSVDTGDPLLSTWRLSWIAHQLVRDPWHLFDANIFYPTRYTLAFSDSILVPALTVAPLLWAGVPRVVAYNLVFLSGFALSGVGMFVLVRSLTGQVGAGLVAGFVFAFLPFRFMHYAHLELQMTFWMPLCLWALHRTLTSGRRRDGLLTGLFFALQTLSCMYYGIFLATFIVPLAGVLLVSRGRAHLASSLRACAPGAVLAGVLLLPIAIPYLGARNAVGERPLSEIKFYSATPLNYLAAHPRNVLLGDTTSGWGQQERELFQGIIVPVIAIVALWPPFSAVRAGYGLAMLVAFDASLGLNGLSYGWLHAFVFPYRGLRVPARMAMLVGCSLSVLVGFGIARLSAKRSAPAAGAIALAAGLLVFGEYRSQLELTPVRLSPPPVYERLRGEPASVLLELPLKTPDIYLEPVYMYFSTFHWHRLVNGYSGFSPASYSRLLGLMTTFPDEKSVAELRHRDVAYVIVHGALFEDPNMFQETIALLDQDPAFQLVGSDPWEGQETRLYRLLPADTFKPDSRTSAN